MRLTKVKQFPYLINEKANEWLRPSVKGERRDGHKGYWMIDAGWCVVVSHANSFRKLSKCA